MIPAIRWSDKWSKENPFLHSDTACPLKITFHTESFVDLSDNEKEAIAQLRRLSQLEDSNIVAFDTEVGPLPSINIILPEDSHDQILVNLEHNGETIQYSGISPQHQWIDIALGITGQPSNDPDVATMTHNLIVAQAHHINQDILITASPWLLENTDCIWVKQANPRSPGDAARIVGLFLRSHNNFTVWIAQRHHPHPYRREFFYWVLVRNKLPSMWKYIEACASKDDSTRDLGLSILTRFSRALQACDGIGIQFYLPEKYTESDMLSYHFDYLTLLLAGAFDAVARITYRCFIDNGDEWHSNFRIRKQTKTGFTNVKNNLIKDLANNTRL